MKKLKKRKVIYTVSIIWGIWIVTTDIITRNYATAALWGTLFIVLPVSSMLKEVAKEKRIKEKLVKSKWAHILSYIITAISVLAFFYIIFNGREYVPGADTRFRVCACIIYISVPVWFILWRLGLGIFRERTSIPQKYVGSHKNTFKNTFKKKQASPYKTSSVNFTERILWKTKMPIYKEPENLLKRVFCYINADDRKLKKNNLCRLFDVDLREGEYVDYVALNKTNGNACYVHCIEGEGKELFLLKLRQKNIFVVHKNKRGQKLLSRVCKKI